MNLLDQLTQKIRSLLTTELSGITPQQRSIHIDNLFEQVRMWSYENYEVGYLTNFFIDDAGAMWAIFDRMGVLFRAQVTVTGGKVTIGELEEVVASYTPATGGEAEQRSFAIKRQTDGSIRFSGIACTAVVNRAGEIDSTTLFDNMIAFAEETGYYPAIDFYHTGDLSPEYLHFGQVDGLARDGIAYLVTGALNPEHPLARMVIDRYEAGKDKWGFSIEYYPFADSEQEIEVGGNTFRMYTNGINTRISILSEQDACSQFTALAVNRMEAMTETQRQKFIEKLGEAETEKLLAAANLRTKQADEQGMVYRTAEEQPSAEAPADALTTERTDEIELDDAALDEIAKRVAALMQSQQSDQVAAVNGQIEKVAGDVAELTRQLTKSRSQLDQLLAAVEDLAADDAQKVARLAADMPASSKLRITHRPRTVRAETPTEPETPTVIKPGDLAQRAESALKSLKRA